MESDSEKGLNLSPAPAPPEEPGPGGLSCPKCLTQNPADARFCKECGDRLILVCPNCQRMVPLDSKFCNKCGANLRLPPPPPADPASRAPEPAELPPAAPPLAEEVSLGAERKNVTVLFSDLSGYTSLSEKLDPEEVKDLMARVFGQAVKIVNRYEGYVDKFIGDALLAVFGVPEAHEDDPVRAIWAAKEIHELVEAISPEVAGKIGRPLSMHTGINTGLVVTGEDDFEAGSQGFLGDTINVASRLMNQAKAGEIFVGANTFQLAQGYFHFESMEPLALKGKAEPVQAYKMLAARDQPQKIRRLSGLRADLVGRKAEMELLSEAVERLMEGKSTIITISGEPGTGKSRLIEEFKASLNLSAIQWREGHAYSYTQKVPYFPLINLMSRAWQLQEGDTPEKLRDKIETRLRDLLRGREDLIPYVGNLYSLPYPELEGITPEAWKSRLQEAILTILGSFSRRAPTVVCLEDLHWADPSSVDLLRLMLSESRDQTLFLLAYRPPFSLFSKHDVRGLKKAYREIQVHDLSRTESQEMVQSLLGSSSLPTPLKMFVQEMAGGNPFYLEEVINALIESGILVFEQEAWRLSRSIQKSDIPASIQDVITARLARLDKLSKRVLQEASVIGKAFHYDVLSRVTAVRENLSQCLSTLERLDLIRISFVHPYLEYVFKHAIIQEVVYNGLLKKDRRLIHERIGLVMEEIFQNRSSEFYETLAFHFKHGQSDLKAVDYLIKSGEKGLERFALDEANEHFNEAYDLLLAKPQRSKRENERLIDLISRWFLVYYYRGDFGRMVELFTTHRHLAESLGDRARLGMFYACLGFSLSFGQEKFEEAYELLKKAFALGEETGDQKVMGYAASWLAWVCGDMALYDEGIRFGHIAQKIAPLFPSDHYLLFKSKSGYVFIYWQLGKTKEIIEIGKSLAEYGRKYSNPRALMFGFGATTAGYANCGDFPLAIKCAKEAIEAGADPFYDQWAKNALGICTIFHSMRVAEAEELLEEVVEYGSGFGCSYLKTWANLFMGVLLVAKGEMSRGLKVIEEIQSACRQNKRRYLAVVIDYVLARIYMQIASGGKEASFASIIKNLGFLIKTVPFASRKAEHHLLQAVEGAREIGAKVLLGQALLDLGLLKKKQGKPDRARELIDNAVELFQDCEAYVYLKLAQEARQSLQQEV